MPDLNGLIDTNAIIQTGTQIVSEKIYSDIPLVNFFLSLFFGALANVTPGEWAFIGALIAGLIITAKADLFIKVFRIGAIIILFLVFFGVINI